MAHRIRCATRAVVVVELVTAAVVTLVGYSLPHPPTRQAAQPAVVRALDRFPMRTGGLQLDRPTHDGAFFDVVGRRSAIVGYENRSFETWVYPLQVFADFSLSFRLEGYPLDITGHDITASIHVRPEATTFTYAHAAFTVRETL